MHPEIIAHRGASYLAPENTLAAFRLAKDMGADGLEFDVQQTKDGQLVIHHDYVIDFHTQLAGNIYDMLSGDLRQLDFGSWKNAIFSEEKIPLLSEALAVGGELGSMMVELKSSVYPNPDFVPAVLETINASGYADKCMLLAFEHDLLRQVRALAPEMKVGALMFGDFTGYFAPPPSLLRDIGLTNSLDEEPSVSNELIDSLNGPQALGAAIDIAEHPDKYGEENSELTRWVTNRVIMLKASFPGQSFYSILRSLGAQRDPAGYIRDLDFKPDYVSCEYHSSYAVPQMVEQLHEQGVKVAFWTPDSRISVRSVMALGPDAIVSNRPDMARRWAEEYESGTAQTGSLNPRDYL